jgi:uncharacterized protein (TIGR03435 family)
MVGSFRVLAAARPLLFVAALSTVFAQPAARFDVASLKPGLPVSSQFNINLGTVQHDTLTLNNASLADCLHFAYSLSNNDQIAGPAWIKDKLVRFDIIAKAPAATSDVQIRLMLQNLLIERFQMGMHREQRVLDYMALTVGKNGPTVRPASDDADTSRNSNALGRIVSARLAMVTFVTLLSRFLREPVLDLTGLPGLYEVRLEWTPDPSLTTAPDAGADAGVFPSIRKAIEEQLGLRLEPHKGPVEVLVVDHADKVPLGN